MSRKRNKWINGVVPSVLLHCCVGTIYCWSLICNAVEDRLESYIGWAFSIAVFVVGLSAALSGPLISRNPKHSALVSTVLFGLGMILSGLACGIGSSILFHISYGILMAIGVGTGYICTIKVLLLWFKENKGLATGLAITGIGLAMFGASPGFNFFVKNYGITTTFIFHGILYMIVMFVASLLLKKPENVSEEDSDPLHNKKLKIKDFIVEWGKSLWRASRLPGIWTYWIVFYLGITAGLALISNEKSFYIISGFGAVSGMLISSIFSISGRLGTAWISDYVPNRSKLFSFLLSYLTFACLVAYYIPAFIPFALFLCCMGYGGMFSIMPSVLADRYGMRGIDSTYGFILSAWSFAGLTGNQLVDLFKVAPESAYRTIILICMILYLLGLVISTNLWKNKTTA